jgi:hypothetical protein
MITSQAGRELRKLVVAYAGADSGVGGGGGDGAGSEQGTRRSGPAAAFQPNADVATLWKEISPLLVSSSAWPQESAERRKRYRKLSQVHHPDKPRGSRDRFAAIADAYKRANYDLDPEVQGQYKGIDDYLANA